MKSVSFILSVLLATAVTARPRAVVQDEPLQESSRVTAFVIDENGGASVECWEITSIVDSMRVNRKDGSKATSHAINIAGRSELEGVDILTWPSSFDVYPPRFDGRSTSAHDTFGMSTASLFNVQNGLVSVTSGDNGASQKVGTTTAKDEYWNHIFSMENGDDWFYFEDTSTSSSLGTQAAAPFQVSTVSATTTEVLRLRYSSQPRHRVIHKGSCQFTGIRTDDFTDSEESSRARSPLTVQVHIEDL